MSNTATRTTTADAMASVIDTCSGIGLRGQAFACAELTDIQYIILNSSTAIAATKSQTTVLFNRGLFSFFDIDIIIAKRLPGKSFKHNQFGWG